MELFTAVSQLYLLLHFTQNQTVTMHGETYSIPHYCIDICPDGAEIYPDGTEIYPYDG